MFVVRHRCRVCRGPLWSVLNLGQHALHCRYPGKDESVPLAPVHLMVCGSCGLAQLEHSVEPALLYTGDYGYRSGQTETMRRHLHELALRCHTLTDIAATDIWVDIGSNDGTLLSHAGCRPVGFDPVGVRFDYLGLIKDYFSAEKYPYRQRAKVVTAIAMFYDLDDPVAFCREVAEILEPEGLFVIEVMYLRDMLAGAWDMLSHEHVCYYGVKELVDVLGRAGFTVFDVEHFPVNGGAIRVYADKGVRSRLASVDDYLRREPGIDWHGFAERVAGSIKQIRQVVHALHEAGKRIDVLGASQKGNTLLQAVGLRSPPIRYASERDERKVGRYTPGTQIPIVSEEDSRIDPPDYYLVLPWHFREEILAREADTPAKFIFPLPEVKVA